MICETHYGSRTIQFRLERRNVKSLAIRVHPAGLGPVLEPSASAQARTSDVIANRSKTVQRLANAQAVARIPSLHVADALRGPTGCSAGIVATCLGSIAHSIVLAAERPVVLAIVVGVGSCLGIAARALGPGNLVGRLTRLAQAVAWSIAADAPRASLSRRCGSLARRLVRGCFAATQFLGRSRRLTSTPNRINYGVGANICTRVVGLLPDRCRLLSADLALALDVVDCLGYLCPELNPRHDIREELIQTEPPVATR